MVRNYYSSARIENHNWWRAEMPTQTEMDAGSGSSDTIMRIGE